jgi:hypothetical protein
MYLRLSRLFEMLQTVEDVLLVLQLLAIFLYVCADLIDLLLHVLYHHVKFVVILFLAIDYFSDFFVKQIVVFEESLTVTVLIGVKGFMGLELACVRWVPINIVLHDFFLYYHWFDSWNHLCLRYFDRVYFSFKLEPCLVNKVFCSLCVANNVSFGADNLLFEFKQTCLDIML